MKWSQVVVLTAWAALLIGPSAMAADAGEPESWTGWINGRELETVDEDDPLLLTPNEDAIIAVDVQNDGASELVIDRIRFEGKILGMSFFVYTTDLEMAVPPSEGDDREFTISLRDLDGLATGSILSQLVLLDPQDNALATVEFPVQIDGSLRSVYGTFGLAIAAMTAYLLVASMWRLATGRLPMNRWQRAMTFFAPGLGIGFVLTFTLSALNVLVPTPQAWVLALTIGGALGFVLGYLTPTPDLGRAQAAAAPRHVAT